MQNYDIIISAETDNVTFSQGLFYFPDVAKLNTFGAKVPVFTLSQRGSPACYSSVSATKGSVEAGIFSFLALGALTMEEIWKPIPGYPGYEASNLGRIRSHRLHRRNFILKPYPNPTGYLIVSPSINGKNKPRPVHCLVMLAFVGPRPEGLEVCHGDGNPANNRLDNLRYDTHKANMEEAAISGTLSLGTSKQQVLEARKMRAEGATLKEIAEKCNISWWTSYNICSGKTHKYLEGLTLSPFEVSRTRARQIREDFATGQRSMAELAEEYGIKKGTVRDIIKGKIQLYAGGPIRGKDY